MILLLVAAAVVVVVPLAAVLLVAFASLREESARSLGGSPRGPLQAAARRLVCFRTSASSDRGRDADRDTLGWEPEPEADDDTVDHAVTMPW